MKAFKGYNETKAYSNSEREQLPKGGYVCEIKKAEVINGQYGEQLKVSLEIAEGDFKGFFERAWRNQEKEDKVWIGTYFLPVPNDDGSERDSWDKRKFKTFTEAVEESNPGYHWDWNEAGLKGKLFGGLFSIRQKKGNNGAIYDNTICSGATSAQNVRDGKYRLPKDKLVDGGVTQAAATDADGFINVGVDDDGALPF